MGVNSLWDILGPTAHPVRLDALSRKRLAVDASIWIYQFLKAVRDADGNTLPHAHIVGFFRRICKLLYYGIRPVFVFDGGAPALKRETISKRRERRQGHSESIKEIAHKLFAIEVQKQLKRKKEGNKDNGVTTTKDTVFFDDLVEQPKVTAPFAKQDEYHLPSLSKFRVQKDDSRIITPEDYQQYIEGADFDIVDGVDINTVDPDSKEFLDLPLATQYMILSHLRLKSRLRMGYRKEQLEAVFPNSMDFSRFQIQQVQKRNFYTQKLMVVSGMDKDVGNVTKRIAGDKDRKYMLQKNDDGYTLSLDEGNSSNPIDLDEENEKVESHNRDKTIETIHNRDLKTIETNRDPKVETTHHRDLKESELDSDSDFEDVPLEERPETEEEFQRSKRLVEDIYGAYLGSSKEQQPNPSNSIFGFGFDDDEKEMTDPIQKSKMKSPEIGNIKVESVSNSLEPMDMSSVEPKGDSHILPDTHGGDLKLPDKSHRDMKSDKSHGDMKSDKSHGGEFKSKLKPSYQPVEPTFEDSVKPMEPTLDDSVKPTEPTHGDSVKPMELTHGDSKPTEPTHGKPMEPISDDSEILDFQGESDLAAKKNHTPQSPGMTASQESEPPKPLPIPSWFNQDVTQTSTFPVNTTSDKYREDEEAGLISWTEAKEMLSEDDEIQEVEEVKSVKSVENVKSVQNVQDVKEVPNVQEVPDVQNVPSEMLKDVQNVQNDIESKNPQSHVFLPDYVYEESDELSLAEQLRSEEEDHKKFTERLRIDLVPSTKISSEQLLREKLEKAKRDSDEVTQTMINDVQELLRRFGIPFITAPMEAEAQCAELIRLGLVDGIITDDSDCFLFGGDRIYKNMFNQKQFVECYIMEEVESKVGLSRDKMIELALMLGSDYTEGISGIGPVLGMEVLAEFGGVHGFKDWFDSAKMGVPGDDTKLKKSLLGKIGSGKLFLPTSFPDGVVVDAYKNPEVDHDRTEFRWGVPNLDEIRTFLMYNANWTQEKVDEVMVPLIRDINKKKQTTLEEFFPREVQEVRMGKRLKSAASKLKRRKNND